MWGVGGCWNFVSWNPVIFVSLEPMQNFTTTTTTPSLGKVMVGETRKKQAGAELCQAEEKLGLANQGLPVVLFHLQRH